MKGSGEEGEDTTPTEPEERENNKENENTRPIKRMPDLKYTADDISRLGDTVPGDDDSYQLDEEEHTDRYVWLICWFLRGVISDEKWKEQVESTITGQSRRRNIAEWMTSSDLAYLCTIYIHSYDKWKREAEMQDAAPGGKLSKQQHKDINKLGRYKPDGISSKEGDEKMYRIQRHYAYKIGSDPVAKERFNKKFWEYYEVNVVPTILEETHLEAPPKPDLEDSPEYKAMMEKKNRRKRDFTLMEEV